MPRLGQHSTAVDVEFGDHAGVDDESEPQPPASAQARAIAESHSCRNQRRPRLQQ